MESLKSASSTAERQLSQRAVQAVTKGSETQAVSGRQVTQVVGRGQETDLEQFLRRDHRNPRQMLTSLVPRSWHLPLTRALLCSILALGLVLTSASASGPDVTSTVDPRTRERTLSIKHDSEFRRAFSIVEPDDSHTKLRVSPEGIKVIERITTPIAAVAVIGPYRSGKSFLLNQLLSLSCKEGFGVGHKRDTNTKGIWVWGEPLEMSVEGGQQQLSVLYFDTEGFESVGKSSVYDDRIFALAAIMSSVLIYNLPETVKEADIAKLSFAVELAQEFYGRVKGRRETFTPAKLLWLIQRDFLEGKTVQEMVRQALKPVPNPDEDKDVDAVNDIRASLALMARNSTAFGLVQPHLQRTKLCEMEDGQLEAKYVQQREELKKIVQSLVSPKLMSGRTVTGPEFVQLLSRTLEALNKGRIPSAGSVVATFNRAVIERCVALYEDAMSGLKLPMSESLILEKHEKAQKGALELFEEDRFGRKETSEEAAAPLVAALQQALEKLKKENMYVSATNCEKGYASCEDLIDRLQAMRLPSTAKFDAGMAKCNQSVEDTCFGPSKASYRERLQKMWARERSQFLKEYNQRLFNWLVVSSLVLVVIGRFIIKWLIVEFFAWGLFIFLETYTRIFFSVEGLYYNPGWRTFVRIWETVVYNPVIDLDTWGIPLAWCCLIAALLYRCYPRKPQDILPRHTSTSPTHRRRE